MKNKKAEQLTDHIDDRHILAASDPASVFGRGRTHVLARRMAVAAACVAALAITATAVLLPAMREEPGNLPETNSALSDVGTATVTEAPAENWISTPDLVNVSYLSVADTAMDGEELTDEEKLSAANIQNGHIGERLVLIRFNCAEGETVVVTPGSKNRLVLVEKKELSYGGSAWMYQENGMDGDYTTFASEYYQDFNHNIIQGIGESVTVGAEDVLLWQYDGCANVPEEDNYVDFTVKDANGAIVGGGSIYIGALDLAEYTGDGIYYDYHNTVLNSICRPAVLGAFRYTADNAVDEAEHVDMIAALHATSAEIKTTLFDDLSADNYKLSMRKLRIEQAEAFGYKTENGGSGFAMSVIVYGTQFGDDGGLDDQYTVVSNKDESARFFLYDGTYQKIETYEELEWQDEEQIYIAYLRLTLTDGTVVHIRPYADTVYEIIPPAVAETM